MPTIAQPSFAGGELAPGLHARVDLARYATGLRLCENFFVLRTGGATNRPGFRFIAEVKDSTKTTVLIPFRFSTDQQYILEFGDQYVRFYRDGGVVVILPGVNCALWSGATAYVIGDFAYRVISLVITIFRCIASHTNKTPESEPTYWVQDNTYELPTPYTAAEVAALYYTQSADVLTIVHPDHAPMELRRLVDSQWELVAISFTAQISAPSTLYGQADDATGSGTEPVRNFSYVVTSVNAAGQESAASTPIAISANLQANHEVVIFWGNVTDATSYNVYRALNGIYGFIGSAINAPVPRAIATWNSGTGYSAGPLVNRLGIIYRSINGVGNTNKPPESEPTFWTTTGLDQSFTDLNIVASLTDTPPVYADPFLLPDASHSYPSVVAYYQQRLAFANSAIFPEKIWLSRSSDYHNFGASDPAKDDDSIDINIVSNEVNAIRHLASIDALVALTSAGEWLITGGADQVITPATAGTKGQGYTGASTLRPVKIGANALYVQELGSSVRDLGYSLQQDRFVGDDLSVTATHLFDGSTVVDWAYAKVPHSLVWAVRDDGMLIALTYMREQEVLAWHHHITDGFVERVAVNSEEGEDHLYAIIRRTVGGVSVRYIERMSTRYVPDVRAGFFVDAGLSYDGFSLSNTDVTVSAAVAGQPISMLAGGSIFGGAAIGDVFVLRVPGVRTGVDAPLDAWYRITLASITDSQTATGIASVDVPAFTAALGDWARGVTTMSGLDHLEGKDVAILADGNVHPTRTVTAGAVTLQDPAVLVHIGLPYVAELETLDLAVQGQTVRDKQKTIEKVTLQVDRSRGMTAGVDRDHLETYLAPDDEPYDIALPLISDAVEIRPATGWAKPGRIVVRQSDPLPITVLSIMPSVSVGG